MTPEERTESIFAAWWAAKGSNVARIDRLKPLIAQAITAAVEAEREACAQLAHAGSDRHDTNRPHVLCAWLAGDIRSRANVSISVPDFDTLGERVQNLTENEHVNPWHDCPTCPACNLPVGHPASEREPGSWYGTKQANLYCPACGTGWRGTPEQVRQAEKSRAAWKVEDERQRAARSSADCRKLGW